MKSRFLLLIALTLASICVFAQTAEERRNWRISVGPSLIGGIRAKVGANNAQIVRMSGFGYRMGSESGSCIRSRDEAYALGSGEANGGKRVFDDGAWYDPVDSAAENDGDWSWNWRLHDPQELDPDGLKGFIERTAYAEESHSEAMTVLGDSGSSSSSECMPGLRLEASRTVFVQEGERPWGIDAAVAFAWYFQRDIWKTSGTSAVASEEYSRTEGYYEWWNDSHDEAQYILDYYRDSQYDGSMWGVGSFGGPGAELASDAWQMRDVVTQSKSWSRSYALHTRGDGSYREYSIEALVRPWWEPWEFLRVFATLGCEISRREFEWSLSANGTDGSSYRESGKASDWRAFGILGGGLSVQWRGFFLLGEALWRFGGDDLSVDGRAVSGKVTHGNWGLRASLGYSF